MTKKIISLIFLVSISYMSFGQIEELQLYKNIYKTADSIVKFGKIYSPDSLIIQKTKLLDKEHPSKYFGKAGELIKESNFNDAAFIYDLGILRYMYFNSVNAEYQASGDGALLTSLISVVGEPINLYLKTNIDNFISILKSSSDYYAKIDYEFYTKNKNIEKYNIVAEYFSDMIKDLEVNKTKYKDEWDNERKEMKENIDKAIQEYNNLSPKEKKRLKKNN